MNSSADNSNGGHLQETTTAFAVLIFSFLYLITLCSIDINGNYIGYGDKVFRNLISFGGSKSKSLPFSYGLLSVFLAAFLLIFVYLSDVLRYVQGENRLYKLLGWVVLLISISVVVSASFLMAYKFLFSPYLGFIAAFIILNGALRVIFLKDLDNRFYFRGMITGTFLSFCVILLVWGISLLQGSVWNSETLVKYQGRLMCDEGKKCNEAIMVYFSPFIFLFSSAIFIGLFIYLYRSEKMHQKSGEEAKIEPNARIFFGLVILSIFALWVTASISSLTKDLASNVLWLSFILIVALFGVWLTIFGVKHFISQLKATSMGTKGIEFLSNDWGKSLILFTSLPFIVLGRTLYLLKKRIYGSKHDVSEPAEAEGKNEHKLENWEYGSVLTKALVWGMVYFLLSVGVPRIVVVFLSALRGWLVDFNLLGISAILLGVGLLLFLLPPVPGVPVYAICGVVIPNMESSVFGFWGGIAYAILLSFVLKLLAIVMQQKLIGELWGSRSVSVRQFIQINSVEIRATRKILSQPGLKLSKIVILCAGPDWPTSVLTGIMRLDVFQMLLGSLPVILLIIPVVLSGAMVVRAGENEIYSSVSTISIVFTVILESVSLLWAAKVIADTAVKYEEELKNEDPDKEVLEIERLTEYREREYRYLTAWRNLGRIWKVGHVLSIVLMVSSSYAFVFLGGLLFEAFAIQDDFSEKLNGKAQNLIKRPGWIFLSLFAFSTIYYLIFTQVFRKRKAPQGAVEPKKKQKEKNSF